MGAIALHVGGAGQELVRGRRVGVGHDGHYRPRRRDEGTGEDQGPPGQPGTQRARRHQGDHDHGQQAEVAALEVQGHRQAHQGRGQPDEAGALDRPPRGGPGEGQCPGGEQLGPDLGPPGPAVSTPLEADAGMADHERAQQRRGQGHPAAQAEQPGGAVNDKGPEGLEQVHRPAESRAGAKDRAHQAGQHRAQALVAHVLGRAEPDVREPRGEREPPGLDGRGGEVDHLVVHGGVVQVGDGQGHRAHAPQVPGHDHADNEEGGAGEKAGPRGTGRRFEEVPQVQADLAPQVVRAPHAPVPAGRPGARHDGQPYSLALKLGVTVAGAPAAVSRAQMAP